MQSKNVCEITGFYCANFIQRVNAHKVHCSFFITTYVIGVGRYNVINNCLLYELNNIVITITGHNGISEI